MERKTNYGYERFCAVLNRAGRRTGEVSLQKLRYDLTCTPGIVFSPGVSLEMLLSELEAVGIIRMDEEQIHLQRKRTRFHATVNA